MKILELVADGDLGCAKPEEDRVACKECSIVDLDNRDRMPSYSAPRTFQGKTKTNESSR